MSATMNLPTAFNVSIDETDPKTMFKNALTQMRAWKALANSLQKRYSLIELDNGEIGNIPTTNQLKSWIYNLIMNFTEEEVYNTNSEMIYNKMVEEHELVNFEEEHLIEKVTEYSTVILNSRKYTIEQLINKKNEEPKVAKKRVNKKKKAVEGPKTVEETSTDDVVTEEPKTNEVATEEPKVAKKRVNKKKAAEPAVEEPKVIENTVEEVTEEPKADEPAVEEPKVTKKRVNKKKGAEQTENNSESGTDATEKKKRGPSAYNIFIKDEINRLRLETPEINHKVAMAMAVAAWKKNSPTRTAAEPTIEATTEETTLENILTA